jgi:hypothetical protein
MVYFDLSQIIQKMFHGVFSIDCGLGHLQTTYNFNGSFMKVVGCL